MKILTLALFVMLLSAERVSGQKRVMELDAGLKANSTAIEAKARGAGSISKYKFGDYAIVSGKEGWGTTKTKSRFFSAVSEAQSKRKLSFVFVGHGQDTVLVDAAIDTNLKEINVGDFPIHFEKGGEVFFGRNWSELRESTENYLAVFSVEADTTKWRMVSLTRMGYEVEGGYQFAGFVTNGVTQIEIKQVKEWGDGKKSAFNIMMGNLIVGYEFVIDEQTLGAVQVSMDSFQKKLVWLRNDMDERLKLVLAAASAAMMVRVETTGAY
ncbi:MAG: hypothetical protein WAZ98_07735 [Cyclobacteriaceae bacterium]